MPGMVVTPKSDRLIFVVAEAPMCGFPMGSFIAELGPSTSSATSRVTPCMDRRSSLVFVRARCAGTILALAVYVMIDLEYPRVGWVRVDAADRVLMDLRTSMK